MHFMRLTPNQDGVINFGWRGWEGDLPTSFIRHVLRIRLWMREQWFIMMKQYKLQ